MSTVSDGGLPASADSGWMAAMGLRIVTATAEEVVVEWQVGPEHKQPHGIVHGGVHSGVIETVCSIGAALHAGPAGKLVVGVENHTSFVRAVRSGRLRGTGRPVHKGARAQLWEAQIVDEQERLVATGRVRLFSVDPEPASQR